MRTPREIYAQYNTMPNLQLHQLRVAAVGKMICENFSSGGGSASGGKKPVNKNDIILACLFHDMGNILKFNLTYFPEFLEPQGLEYWERVKSEYKEKYGRDQHEASKKIAREIDLSAAVVEIIDMIGFSKIGDALAGDSFENKICVYADSRVGPRGVLTLEERFIDGRKRYLARGVMNDKEKEVTAQRDTFEALIELAHKLETQIFAAAMIRHEDITDTTVAPIIEELWEYPVA